MQFMDRVEPWKQMNPMVLLTEHMDTHCVCLCISPSLCISRESIQETGKRKKIELGARLGLLGSTIVLI